MLSRVIVGSKTSIYSTLLLVVGITVIGTIVGIICGWNGKKLDTILMRISDIFLAFPGLVFALAVAAVMGGGVQNAVIALGAISWPKYARIARSQTLAQKESLYMRAAILSGCSTGKLILKHILPNITGTDPCDCHAGYRNDDDGACRPVVSGTWCKTAGCGVGKHDE